jgi:tetratricopeptide (TPR) repeat protein
MSQLSQALMSEASLGRMLSDREVSRFSATEIREAIADLVVQGRMDLANALGDAGISLYPDSEDMLAMVALLAESRQDWTAAEELLAKLLLKQGAAAPVASWQHYIRVLRCLCEWQAAILIMGRALEFYPGNPALMAELQSLEAQLGDSQPMDTNETRH